MKIEYATADDVRFVAFNMRERDFDEFRAVSPVDTREAMADLMAERYGGRPDVLCATHGGAPVAIGGTIEARPNVVTLLFFATDAFPRIALPLTRFIRKQLFPRYKRAGVHRIEAVSMVGHDDAHGWLRALGLAPETEPLRGYGKNREDFVQFSEVVDADPAGA